EICLLPIRPTIAFAKSTHPVSSVPWRELDLLKTPATNSETEALRRPQFLVYRWTSPWTRAAMFSLRLAIGAAKWTPRESLLRLQAEEPEETVVPRFPRRLAV